MAPAARQSGCGMATRFTSRPIAARLGKLGKHPSNETYRVCAGSRSGLSLGSISISTVSSQSERSSGTSSGH
jgi:hypothetical protein